MVAVTERTVALVNKQLALKKPKWARRAEVEHKVPVVPHLWPEVFWIACVAGEGAEQPTELEIRQVASYIDYVLEWFYGDTGFARDVRELALPLAAGHNTVIFVKHPEVAKPPASWVGWGYKRQSWDSGSWPHSYQSRAPEGIPDHPLSLPELLDCLCGYGSYPFEPNPRWEAWKVAHPELFS